MSPGNCGGIFHRLEERRRCLYLLGQTMHPPFQNPVTMPICNQITVALTSRYNFFNDFTRLVLNVAQMCEYLRIQSFILTNIICPFRFLCPSHVRPYPGLIHGTDQWKGKFRCYKSPADALVFSASAQNANTCLNASTSTTCRIMLLMSVYTHVCWSAFAICIPVLYAFVRYTCSLYPKCTCKVECEWTGLAKDDQTKNPTPIILWGDKSEELFNPDASPIHTAHCVRLPNIAFMLDLLFLDYWCVL